MTSRSGVRARTDSGAATAAVIDATAANTHAAVAILKLCMISPGRITRAISRPLRRISE